MFLLRRFHKDNPPVCGRGTGNVVLRPVKLRSSSATINRIASQKLKSVKCLPPVFKRAAAVLCSSGPKSDSELTLPSPLENESASELLSDRVRTYSDKSINYNKPGKKFNFQLVWEFYPQSINIPHLLTGVGFSNCLLKIKNQKISKFSKACINNHKTNQLNKNLIYLTLFDGFLWGKPNWWIWASRENT